MNRLGTLERSGVPLAFGTDSPVTPLAGWATVQAAVQHWQPGERLSVASAFDAATRGGHWAAFADNAGTVQVGAVAILPYGTSEIPVWKGPHRCPGWMLMPPDVRGDDLQGPADLSIGVV